jgi:hypothetical protein
MKYNQSLSPGQIPTEFLAKDDQLISFDQLHQEFAATTHGENLKENIRFAHFKAPQLSDQEWVKLLGYDVNNLHHMPLTYGLTRRFLQHHQLNAPAENLLTESEILTLCLTAKTHDRAEAVTGDVNYSLKTDALEKREAGILRQMLLEMTEKYLTAEQIEEIVQTAFNKKSKLGEIFSLIEKIGYLRTALNVWDQSGRSELTKFKLHQPEQKLSNSYPPLSEGTNELDWLVFDVICNQLRTLIAAASNSSSVKAYLESQKAYISEIFDKMPPSVLKFYPPEKQTTKGKEFEYSSKAWQGFLLPALLEEIQEVEASAAQ